MYTDSDELKEELEFINFIKKNSQYYNLEKETLNINTFEIFENAPIKQRCLDLCLNCELPISTISFDKKQAITAILFVLAKTSFFNEKDYKFFLNKKTIKNIDIDYFDYYKSNIVEKNNIIAIEHLSFKNYRCFLQTMCYPVYSQDWEEEERSSLEYYKIWKDCLALEKANENK